MIFDSMNPYESMFSLSGETPDELITAIKNIRVPVKIISIVVKSNKYTAFMLGDVREAPKRKEKGR